MPRRPNTTADNYDAPFPVRLRQLMAERNVTQIQLSQSIGVARQTISIYMDGSTMPDIEKAAKIAAFFGVSVDYLSGNTDIRAAQADVKTAVMTTGLSSVSVDTLSIAKRISENGPDGTHLIDMLNTILEDTYMCMDGYVQNTFGVSVSENGFAENNSALLSQFLKQMILDRMWQYYNAIGTDLNDPSINMVRDRTLGNAYRISENEDITEIYMAILEQRITRSIKGIKERKG